MVTPYTYVTWDTNRFPKAGTWTSILYFRLPHRFVIAEGSGNRCFLSVTSISIFITPTYRRTREGVALYPNRHVLHDPREDPSFSHRMAMLLFPSFQPNIDACREAGLLSSRPLSSRLSDSIGGRYFHFDTFSNEMILYINMFRTCMVFRVLGESDRTLIVDVNDVSIFDWSSEAEFAD